MVLVYKNVHRVAIAGLRVSDQKNYDKRGVM